LFRNRSSCLNLGSPADKFRARPSVIPRNDNATLRRSPAKYLYSVGY
jgi:hypothetical protein